MSEPTDSPPATPDGSGRCPNCDFLALPGDAICRMCGTSLPQPADTPGSDAADSASLDIESVRSPAPLPAAAPDPTAVAEAERPAPEPPAPPPQPTEDQATPAEAPPPPEAILDVDPAPAQPADVAPLPEPDTASGAVPLPPEVEMVMRERQAPLTTIMTAVVAVITIALGYLVLQASAEVPLAVQLFPTVTPLPPTMTLTPSVTPFPTETTAPTLTPTITNTPRPTDTPRPPRFHTVQANESLFTLAVFYGITIDSIAAANERLSNSPLLVEEEIVIPWPTATPPLVAVTVELDGQVFVADPLDCANLYEIQANDSLVSIGGQFNVDFRAILAVNGLTAETLIRPGDTICIPRVDLFDGELPPTPGPSPTPRPPQPPVGPALLFPPDNTAFAAGATPVVQWAAVKNLAPDEWYMVEVVDLTDLSSFPRRGFTRDTAFVLPPAWQPAEQDVHSYRWNVRIVLVTGQRADGAFIRSYGGRTSKDGFFNWEGSAPTPTPGLTPQPTPTP